MTEDTTRKLLATLYDHGCKTEDSLRTCLVATYTPVLGKQRAVSRANAVLLEARSDTPPWPWIVEEN